MIIIINCDEIPPHAKQFAGSRGACLNPGLEMCLSQGWRVDQSGFSANELAIFPKLRKMVALVAPLIEA